VGYWYSPYAQSSHVLALLLPMALYPVGHSDISLLVGRIFPSFTPVLLYNGKRVSAAKINHRPFIGKSFYWQCWVLIGRYLLAPNILQ